MSRAIAVLRPEPGNSRTAAMLEARGAAVIRLPLFAVRPLGWHLPDPSGYDALIVTSANAFRHGGAGLAQLQGLPVYAVGNTTAEAARAAGFSVVAVGDAGATTLVKGAEQVGVRRALHLAGREHTLQACGIVASVVPVYASDPLPARDVARLAGSVALVQSARAGARLAELVDAAGVDRGGIRIVAVSDAAGQAAGEGWAAKVAPRDLSGEALLDLAIALAD
jgi:uroporphyrinogen-III synthase